MHHHNAPYKPSRMGRFLGLLQQPDLPDHHTLVDGLAHIIDGQRGHAKCSEGLHLDARAVARPDCGRYRYPIASDLELDVDGGEIQAVTQWYELWRLLGSHHTGDPCRVQYISLGQSRLPQQPYSLGRHAYRSPGDGGAPNYGLLPHVDHSRRALAVEMREFHSKPPCQHFS